MAHPKLNLVSKLNAEISLLNQALRWKDTEIQDLKKRLGKYENVGNSSEMYQMQPIQLVLRNPLILTKILKYAKTSKSVRLVCKAWNEILLAKQKPTLVFNFNKFHYHFKTRDILIKDDEEFVTDNKVAKSVVIDATQSKKFVQCKGLPPCLPRNGIQDFNRFCKRFSQDIQILKMSWNETFTPIFAIILTDECPNLKQLELKITTDLGFMQEISTRDNICNYDFPNRSKLQEIRVENAEKNRGQFITEFVQKLLNSAPNVEIVSIAGVGIPNLTNNTKVSTFEFIMLTEEEREGTRESFEINQARVMQMSELLARIKDTIKVLRFKRSAIGPTWQFPPTEPIADLIIPTLPYLHTFQNSSLSNFRLGDDLKLVNEGQFPSLRNLTLGVNSMYGRQLVERITQNVTEINSLHSGVTNLCLETRVGVFPCGEIKNLKVAFPSLDSLTVEFYNKAIDCSYIPIQQLEELGLEYLNFNIQHEAWSTKWLRLDPFVGLKRFSVTQTVPDGDREYVQDLEDGDENA